MYLLGSCLTHSNKHFKQINLMQFNLIYARARVQPTPLPMKNLYNQSNCNELIIFHYHIITIIIQVAASNITELS